MANKISCPPTTTPGATSLEEHSQASTADATAPSHLFAFSLPSPIGGRSGRPRDPNQDANSPTPSGRSTSLSTPYSPPLLTPNDNQILPLPYPLHSQVLGSGREDTGNVISMPGTAITIPLFAYSMPPDNRDHAHVEDHLPSRDLLLPSLDRGSGLSPVSCKVTGAKPDHEEGISGALDPSDVQSEHMTPRVDGDDEADDSPYPEVRACVSNIDDPDTPALTMRMWLIGLTLCSLVGCTNIVLSLRWPSVWIGPTVITYVQAALLDHVVPRSDDVICVRLLAYLVGKTMERVMPIRVWTIPGWLPLIGGQAFSLNPGPFNIKEHGLIFMMANSSVTAPYGLGLVLTARKYYELQLGPSFSFCLYTSTLILPYSFGWFTRRLFVHPSSIIWPTSLVSSALLNALHAGNAEEGLRVTRVRFFVIATFLTMGYYLLPGFLFTGLSYFSFICWIRPSNPVVNQLFGTVTGLGMSVLSFDWSQIAFIGSPLMVPWWISGQIFCGFVIFYWIALPILYYTNSWKTGHLPITGYMAYDRFARPYDVDRVLNPDKTLNVTAYAEYSPLYIPISFIMTYLIAFIITTAMVVATILDHGPEIWRAMKQRNVEDDDIHARLMRKYPEVPGMWYAAVLVVFLGLAIVAVKIEDVDTPVWALLLALALSAGYLIPELYVYSCSGQVTPINLVSQIVAGSIWHGKPITVMVFKTFAVQWHLTSPTFTENLKLGHYLKVPPRCTLLVHLVAGVLVTAFQVALQQWIFDAVPDLCESDQKGMLTCPSAKVYYTASIIWGIIGPKTQFSKGSLQPIQLYGLLAGALLPLAFWSWRHLRLDIRLRPVSVLLLVACYQIPPATGINYSSWFLVSFIFQYVIRTRHFRWWLRYNYILSAALQSGTAIGVLLVFLLLQLPKAGTIKLDWWGNTVWMETADARGVAYYPTDPDKGF